MYWYFLLFIRRNDLFLIGWRHLYRHFFTFYTFRRPFIRSCDFNNYIITKMFFFLKYIIYILCNSLAKDCCQSISFSMIELPHVVLAAYSKRMRSLKWTRKSPVEGACALSTSGRIRFIKTISCATLMFLINMSLKWVWKRTYSYLFSWLQESSSSDCKISNYQGNLASNLQVKHVYFGTLTCKYLFPYYYWKMFDLI